MPVVATEEDLDPDVDMRMTQRNIVPTFPTSQQMPPTTHQRKLFEDFYILGCLKRDYTEFDGDANLNEGIVKA